MIFKRLSVIVILLFCLSFVCHAEEASGYQSQLEASGATTLFDSLDDEQKDLLEELGIECVDYESLFSPSVRSVFDMFFQVIRNEYKTPFSSAAVLAAMVLLAATVNLFLVGKSGNTAQLLVSLIAAVSIIVPLGSCLTRAVSAINAQSDFMLCLIPVLAGVITVSGNPTLALSYNSMVFGVAQFVSLLADNYIRPLIQILLSLSVVSSIGNIINIGKIVEFIKKTVLFVMSITATVFITMLSIKGVLASSADTVAVRGIRFLIGKAIPVVGSAVSDAYLSIVGSLNLVKNTAAVFGIVAIAVINLPVLAECVAWIFMLNLLGTLCDVLALNSVAPLFRCVASCVTLLAVILVFGAVTFLLSVGLIMLFKGS